MIRTETTIRVRYVETDAMGFAHHSNYLAWFELARIEMLKTIDLSYKELEREGHFLPVLEASIKYKKPARFEDELTIVCHVREVPKLRIHIAYEVFRDGTLLSTGSTDHAFINKSGLPTRPPQHFVERFKNAFKTRSGNLEN